MSGGAEINGGHAGDATALRLAPDMASLRLLVLSFIRAYIGRWGASPSYGEIAAATRSNRTRVRKAVRSLSDDGLILRAAGPRGLSLPDRRDEALRVLKALGWEIRPSEQDSGAGKLVAPAPSVTNGPLQLADLLGYHRQLPGDSIGDRAGPVEKEQESSGHEPGGEGGGGN